MYLLIALLITYRLLGVIASKTSQLPVSLGLLNLVADDTWENWGFGVDVL